MPIYEFICEKCKKEEEVISTSVSRTIIPICCGSDMKKVISSKFGFKMMGECNAADGYTYQYTDCKAGGARVKSVHGRKTIDKKMASMRQHVMPGKEKKEG